MQTTRKECKSFNGSLRSLLSITALALISQALTTGPALAAFAAPTHLTAVAGASGSKTIKLTWLGTVGADTYLVYRSTGAAAVPTTVYKTLGRTGTFVDKGLAAGTKYNYKVVAVGAGASSAQSAAVSATAR